jgi:hypothetical protein
MDCFDEIGGLYAEHLRQRRNRKQADIDLSTLQRSNRISMEVRKFCEPLLGEFTFLAYLAQPFAERY